MQRPVAGVPEAVARAGRHDDRPAAVEHSRLVLEPELGAILGSERFLNEIKVTASLNHPHILPLHDSGEAAGFLYYVMPFVEGESLRDRLADAGRARVESEFDLRRNAAALAPLLLAKERRC